jgi:hypothetical protein
MKWTIALLENLGVKVKAVGMGKVTQSSGGYIKKHNYNIRIIVIILKDILYKVAIEAVHGSTEGCR